MTFIYYSCLYLLNCIRYFEDESTSIKESFRLEDSTISKIMTKNNTINNDSNHADNIDDNNSDNEINSFSRLPYGSEENVSDDSESDEGDLSSSRPKILSFAGIIFVISTIYFFVYQFILMTIVF